MEESSKHISVMTQEVLEYLQPVDGGSYLDCTFGAGGHSRAILEAGQTTVTALDRDAAVESAALRLQKVFGERFRFYQMSYREVGGMNETFDGALFDLGLSSDQLETSGRGFSFQRTEPLDMRFDPSQGKTAAHVLNQVSPKELERIFSEYGQDRYSKRLTAKVVERRRTIPFRTTEDFVEVIGTTHPQVLAPLFQAVRIAVNDELATLASGLEEVLHVLKPGGRLVVISFHSIEDRIVKEFIRNHMEVITKKPVQPTVREVEANPRSRSAKLRAGVKQNQS